MDNSAGVSLQDYMSVLRRRRFTMACAFVGVLALVLAIITLLPERYRSAAVIMIESPEVRGEFVGTTMSVSSVDLRIDRMHDLVVRNSNLLPIIEELALYPDIEPDARPGAMRGAIDVPKILDPGNDPRKQVTGGDTIGFEVAFVHESPEIAQAVAARLADLFLKENIANRTATVTQTSSFLAGQGETLKTELTRTEQALSEFKRRNAGSLPSDTDLNLQLLDRSQRDADGVEREIRTLQERKNLLMTDLSRTPASATLYSEKGDPILGTEERLEVLRREYVSMASRYSPEHPDVVKLRKEIALLSDDSAALAGSESVQDELDAKRAELSALRQRYADDHPDVKRLERTIDGLLEQLKTAPRTSPGRTSSRAPNNPVYVQMQVQIQGVDNELAALRRDRDGLRARIRDYETRIGRAPETERELLALTRDYEIASKDYDGIREKQSEAERAVAIEDQQRAERYVLQRAAALPGGPAQPTHLTLLFVGVFLGLTAAIATGLLKEALDVTVRGARDLRAMLSTPPIAVIPMIENHGDAWRRVRRRAALAFSFAAVAVLGFFVVV